MDDTGLIALLTGAGRSTIDELLKAADGLVGLAGMEAKQMYSNGVTQVRATKLAAAFELSRRMVRARRSVRPEIRNGMQAHQVCAPYMAAMRHEELWCLALDPHSRLIGAPRVVSKGDVDGTDAGPRAFFRMALAAGATVAMAVHNHPTGDSTPSAADRAVTLRLVAAGRAVDIALVDHIVIGDGGRYSSLRAQEPGLFR